MHINQKQSKIGDFIKSTIKLKQLQSSSGGEMLSEQSTSHPDRVKAKFEISQASPFSNLQKTLAKTPQDHIGKSNNVFNSNNSGSAGDDQDGA